MMHPVQFDLAMFYIIGALIGCFATVTLMQKTWQSDADQMDPSWLRHIRRATLAVIALSMLYGADYVARESAQPWLPNVLLVWAVTCSMVFRIVAIIRRAPLFHKIVEAGFIKIR